MAAATLKTAIDLTGASYEKNRRRMIDLVSKFKNEEEQICLGGGAKAIDIVKQYPGRFELMHVKDEIKSSDGKERYESTMLGKGIVSVKEVIDLGKKSGTLHFIIEQESYQGKTPLECLNEDLKIMRSWGY